MKTIKHVKLNSGEFPDFETANVVASFHISHLRSGVPLIQHSIIGIHKPMSSVEKKIYLLDARSSIENDGDIISEIDAFLHNMKKYYIGPLVVTKKPNCYADMIKHLTGRNIHLFDTDEEGDFEEVACSLMYQFKNNSLIVSDALDGILRNSFATIQAIALARQIGLLK